MTPINACSCGHCDVKNEMAELRAKICTMTPAELKTVALDLALRVEQERLRGVIAQEYIDDLLDLLKKLDAVDLRDAWESQKEAMDKVEVPYEQFVAAMVLQSVITMRDNALGLLAEAGEVAGKVYKAQRDTDGYVDKQSLGMELGDVLFYITAIGNAIGWTLKEIEIANRAKLTARKLNGTLQGSGDTR